MPCSYTSLSRCIGKISNVVGPTNIVRIFLPLYSTPMVSHLSEDYPVHELCRARDEFWHRWNNTLGSRGLYTRDTEVVQRVTYLSHAFPPATFMRNALPYPFTEEDAFYPTPEQLFSHARQESSSRPTSSQKRRRLDDGDLGRLGEKAVTEKKRHRTGEGESDDFFICDVCDTESATRSGILGHLKKKRHPTASRYRKRDDTVELVAPRDAAHECGSSRRENGWTEDDTVVYCPSCHLVVPDKASRQFCDCDKSNLLNFTK